VHQLLDAGVADPEPNAAVVVADMLGHSSIRVTADVYSHFVLSRQEQAAAVMDDIMPPVGSSR